MRLATYNVEWFDGLFDDDGVLLLDEEWSSRRDVTRRQQAQALGLVFHAMDADAVMLIEAPDTSRKRETSAALDSFAKHFGLRTTAVATGFTNTTQQEIALLYDPTKLTARHDPQEAPNAPFFDQQLMIDLDVDASGDPVVFSKPPLELQVETTTGQKIRLLGAHLKSKAPYGAKNRDDAIRISIANRRKQLAQAIWLRRRIEAHLAQGESLILMGDLNDGPGLDEFESLFGRSSVEIILGDTDSRLYDPHADDHLRHRFGFKPTTSRFYLKDKDCYMQALIDYVMVSPDLRAMDPKWRIWHSFNDPKCWRDETLRHALLTASDHFPVSIDLPL